MICVDGFVAVHGFRGSGLTETLNMGSPERFTLLEGGVPFGKPDKVNSEPV